MREDVVADQLEEEQHQVGKLLLVLHRRRIAVQVVEQLRLEHRRRRRRQLLGLLVVGREIVGIAANFGLPTLEKLRDDEGAVLAGSHGRDGPLAQRVYDGLVVGGKLQQIMATSIGDLARKIVKSSSNINTHLYSPMQEKQRCPT